MPTKQTAFRLDDKIRGKIDAIRERYGLPTPTAAVRFAVETTFRQLGEAPKKIPKKSRVEA